MPDPRRPPGRSGEGGAPCRRQVVARAAPPSATVPGRNADGTQTGSASNAKACAASGMRSNVSDISEAHPSARERPCIESRMLGNLHVRFGKRDGETCPRKGIERFISTFTMSSISCRWSDDSCARGVRSICDSSPHTTPDAAPKTFCRRFHPPLARRDGALLSQMPEHQRATLLRKATFERYGSGSPMSVEAVQESIRLSLHRGWFVSASSYSPDLGGVSVPVVLGDRIFAATVAGPLFRMQPRMPELARILQNTVEAHLGRGFLAAHRSRAHLACRPIGGGRHVRRGCRGKGLSAGRLASQTGAGSSFFSRSRSSVFNTLP